MSIQKLGNYIRQIDTRNTEKKVSLLLGVSIEKQFIESIANTIGTDMSTYKIVRKGQFAYGPVTSRNGDKVSIALLEQEECIISSSYTVFEITDTEVLLPQYLMLWFRRPEFDRYARFHSHGSAREIFDWDELCNVLLPIPAIDEQKTIVKRYTDIEHRITLKRKINDNLAETIDAIFINLYQNIDEESAVPF
jgi:type I restriction enzyme S subunit